MKGTALRQGTRRTIRGIIKDNGVACILLTLCDTSLSSGALIREEGQSMKKMAK